MDEHAPRTPTERLIVEALLEVAMRQADDLPRNEVVKAALKETARGAWAPAAPSVAQVLHEGGPGVEVLTEFFDVLRHVLDELRRRVALEESLLPSSRDPNLPILTGRPKPVEDANSALTRQAIPDLLNEILAGGAVAASFTAAASIVKAKIEATTQRQKNELEAQTQRLKIESQERIAGLQAMTAPAEAENGEADST
ncbi:hypothetical protein ACTWJ8_40080 (plasmid) [Streptomyces sp. SDT5-1]|uniref:hypothetical protein n=1 Tax=Streptomyces sp. SDT5-1 TaxID=3406418 RepID=UPI003FD01596